MEVEISLQTLITFGSAVTAAVLLVERFAKGVRWFDRQEKQTSDIEELRQYHDDDKKAINEELTLLTFGILACLKGLREQGCNGPVTEAIGKIEKHLNQKAHEN